MRGHGRLSTPRLRRSKQTVERTQTLFFLPSVLVPPTRLRLRAKARLSPTVMATSAISYSISPFQVANHASNPLRSVPVIFSGGARSKLTRSGPDVSAHRLRLCADGLCIIIDHRPDPFSVGWCAHGKLLLPALIGMFGQNASAHAEFRWRVEGGARVRARPSCKSNALFPKTNRPRADKASEYKLPRPRRMDIRSSQSDGAMAQASPEPEFARQCGTSDCELRVQKGH